MATANSKQQTANNVYEDVVELVNVFSSNEAFYLSTNYSEAEVRQDFIDKFFTALGWDVAHDLQKNPYQQEVKVEKGQKQEDSNNKKRADYAFSLAPDYRSVRFFVEAKKPSKVLLQNKNDYFQTAKYGWNASTGVSILTDFEEMIILDCRAKPDIDTILNCQIKYYRYTDFKDRAKFEELYWIFSREAVEAGNLATFIENLPTPKSRAHQLSLLSGAYQAIDDSFLNYIDNIRLQMAQAFLNNNKNWTSYQLTEATQRTIDRLVFMRFLEDKQIEPDNLMNAIANSQKSWAKFIATSKRLDVKYNGIVFKPHFIDQDDCMGADEVIFKSLATDFDHTNSPYDFNYIPIHVLGNIYERFLGKVIDIHKDKTIIESKPEIRKAGGVFYTPKYIVDYIVKNTLSPMVDNKKPADVSKLKIADISCGSGSFLIGVYEYLLNYYENYYNNYDANSLTPKRAGCHYDHESGRWVLSIRQKQQILLDNIFGVDIDLQAIEVTQLSLFLKLLEDESLATANEMQVLFHEKILPDLTGNIQCGNTLVGNEIFDNPNYDTAAIKKLRPFAFEQSFPTVFERENKGFDILVGNPPYVKEYTNRQVFEDVRSSNLAKYYQGKMDLWYFFVCHGLDLLSSKGLLGYIVPNNWVSNSGASILRNKIIADSKIKSLIDFAGFMVFDAASIQTMVMLLEKANKPQSYKFHHQVFKNQKLSHQLVQKELIEAGLISDVLTPVIDRKLMLDKYLKFTDDNIELVLNKILSAKNFDLDDRSEVAQGIVAPQDTLNRNGEEELKYTITKGSGIFVLSNAELAGLKLDRVEKKLIKPYFTTDQLNRYCVNKKNTHWIIYTDSSFKDPYSMSHYPKIKEHLDRFQKIITSHNKPYGLHRSRNEDFFKGDKIISLRKTDKPCFTYTNFDCYVSQTFFVIKSKRIDMKYLTAILNSKLVEFWLRHKGKMQGENFQIDKEPLLQIPLVKTGNKELLNRIIQDVDQLLIVNQEALEAQTDADKIFYENRIKSLELKINQIVYSIYGLDKDDIKLIEAQCT